MKTWVEGAYDRETGLNGTKSSEVSLIVSELRGVPHLRNKSSKIPKSMLPRAKLNGFERRF